MRATQLLIRADVRSAWRALLALSVITAISCGFVLTAIDGARRTPTSWTRLSGDAHAPQAILNVDNSDRADVTRILAGRQDIALAAVFAWIPASVEGMPGADQQGMFAGLGPGFGTTVYAPVIERGRAADPARPDEITVNDAYAELARVGVGSHVRLTGPGGIDQPATVVGIHRSPLEIGPNGGEPDAQGTPAFMARWWTKLANIPGFDAVQVEFGIRVRRGADVDRVLRSVRAQLPDDASVVGPAQLDSDVKHGLVAATTAYLVLASVSAAGTILLLSFLIGRSMRTSTDDAAFLAALGATRRQRALAAFLPRGLAVTAGVGTAVLISILASPLVRTGLAKMTDPARGVWVDPVAVIGAALILACLLLASGAFSAWRVVAIAREPAWAMRRPPLLRWVEHTSPAALIGGRAAVGGAGRATRLLARSTLVAFVFAMTGLVATMFWISSSSHLADDYALQGWNFDVTAAANVGSDATALTRADAALKDSAEVDQLVSYRQTTITIHGVDVDAFALSNERGTYAPTLLRGFAPRGLDEIAIGPQLARSLHVDVGDRLALPAAHGNLNTTVVGIAVFPLIGNTSFGTDVLMTAPTLARTGAETLNRGYLVGLTPGADVHALQRSVGIAVTITHPFSPPAILRLHDATGIAAALAVFFGLFAVVVLVFALVTSTRRRRRELAVARAIGFERSQVYASLRWQAGVILAIGLVWAVPLGVALGHGAWRLSSRSLDVLDASTVPLGALAVVGMASAVLLALATAVIAAGPARSRIGAVLRSE